MYDKNNIFAQIISGKLSSKKIYEDDKILAFHDVNPSAKIHILVVPKGEYMDYTDFITKAPNDEIKNYFAKILEIIKDLGLDEAGYSLVTNKGISAGQTVFHFHTHIMSGEK